MSTRSPALLRTAYLLTQDGHLAEDLVQVALARAWRSWGRIEPSPEAYVRRILVNTYASWWRQTSKAMARLRLDPTLTQEVSHGDG